MIKKLSIDRALWGQGALLNEDGTMCCLGHLGKACGLTDRQLAKRDKDYFLSIGMPNETSQKAKRLYPKWALEDTGVGADPSDAEQAAIINDGILSPAMKEAKLKAIFKRNGIALTFKGKFKTVAK